LAYYVRAMTRNDITAVNELDREVFPDIRNSTNFQSELENFLARYIVIFETDSAENKNRDADKLIGYAGLWLMVSEAHVVNIAVSNNRRRNGAGELLLIALIELALQMNCNMITLEVRVSNITAQKLYEKCGFIPMGIRKGYYNDNNEDGIIMTIENINSNVFGENFKKLKENYRKKRGPIKIDLAALAS